MEKLSAKLHELAIDQLSPEPVATQQHEMAASSLPTHAEEDVHNQGKRQTHCNRLHGKINCEVDSQMMGPPAAPLPTPTEEGESSQATRSRALSSATIGPDETKVSGIPRRQSLRGVDMLRLPDRYRNDLEELSAEEQSKDSFSVPTKKKRQKQRRRKQAKRGGTHF